MRIAFAIHDVRPGGGQDRYGLELVNALSENHEVTVFARSADQIRTAVRFRRIATPSRPGALRAWAFARRARQALQQSEWDVVHTIGGAMPGAGVITAQYCQAGWRNAARMWPSALEGRIERPYRGAETRAAIRNERRAARHPNLRALIGVSERTLAEWRDNYRPVAKIQTVIPNGVDLSKYSPGSAKDRASLRESLSLPSSARIVLTVGALVRKGIETALQAVAPLDSDVHLVAVGAGPHGAVNRLAARAGVAPRVHLISPVPDIERLYRGADLFLFPTRYEPFGMVVAEAWACGVPVVASRVTGAVEWADPGLNALVVDDPTDHEGFGAAAKRVLQDPGLATQLAHNGRALAQSFSWDRVVRETEAVYRQAVESG